MIEDAFFHELLADTKEAFLKSSLANKKWNYSICGTPMRKGKGLIVGLNWGGKETDPQLAIPDGSDIENYNFIVRSKPFLEKYLQVKNVTEINYSNICFFRSPSISHLTECDIKLSEPLFYKYLNYIKPPWTVVLSNNITFLPSIKTWEKVTSQFNGKVFSAYRASHDEMKFYALPHPNAHLKSEVRHDLWEKVFGQK